MIKFTGSRDGRLFIGFGLSQGNIDRLKEGKPIVVNLEELNLPYHADILILYGETEQSLTDELNSYGVITPETIVHKEKSQPN